MIEKMKMVCVVSTVSGKQEMLEGLRQVGVLHLAEKQAADRSVSERFANLSKTASALLDYAPDKKEGKPAQKPVLPDSEFEALYGKVLETLDRKADLTQKTGAAQSEIERISAWGDFSPAAVRQLRKDGFDLHFYRLSPKDLETVKADENVRYIRLASVEKMDTIAVLGKLPETVQATEFNLPDKSISELKEEIKACGSGIADCTKILREAALCENSFQNQMLKAQNAEYFSAASETAGGDADFVWLSGYVPEGELEKFKEAAAAGGWAYAVSEVEEDDDQVPTRVKYNKVTRLIKPVFDILGILPGYREMDVSIWFLLFFTLFFAMIIGDAGYGVLILLGTVAFVAKKKKFNDATFLLLILSIATIIWGAITGTWFGMESAMKVPILKAMVVPSFANYPEYFNVTTTAQQNMIMKFSFSIGAIQMAIGSILAIRKKISEKNLSWVADLGWLFAIVAMYLLSLYLVIGENVPIVPVFVIVGIAFVLVVLFGGMSPDKTFAAGLKSGLADAFTVFLNTISCFGNVMSYIRLFAVGMAGLAISQSFNAMAAGFKGPLIFAAVLIVIVGHALNIVMCFLSVVVHGVRLNVLEFSGQAGLEWTGIEYEPFKKLDKIKK